MEHIGELFSPERVTCRAYVSSKKKALELISGLVADSEDGVVQNEVFSSLIERERLGSTGLGRGIAIPHGRLKSLDHAVCAFVKLNQGVDYDAADGQEVDMICALLVPEESTNEHLHVLSMLAEMFSDEDRCARLRAAKTGQEVYDLLASWRSADLERAAGPSA